MRVTEGIRLCAHAPRKQRATIARASGGCAPPVPAARWSTPAGSTALRCSVRGCTAKLAARPPGRAAMGWTPPPALFGIRRARVGVS